MKIGAVYPQTELGGDPAALGRIGRAVESLGYDHLLMYDHVVGAVHENRDPPLLNGPYTDRHPFHDPFTSFGYLAGITQRLELVTGVIILPQRQTVLVAKQAAEVDLLSGERLRLGVGAGWNYVEYEALGQDFTTRGARLTEQIDFLRRLWAEPLVSFEGRFDRIDRGNILPRPRRRIPIWCGGYTEPAYRRAARQADGFLFGGSVKGVLKGWTFLQQLLRENGRDVSSFGAEYIQNALSGAFDLDSAVDGACRWKEAGGTHVTVVSMGHGFTTVEQHLDFFARARERFVAALGPGS
ncbi:MAG TPA: LLM class F420-dependent oxidoreductase [Nevskiaceae bacterium]|nr:LLM class F420-dependent oxidoreductase [Nevskiaceae bacterium]